jgi:hypothetical protein
MIINQKNNLNPQKNEESEMSWPHYTIFIPGTRKSKRVIRPTKKRIRKQNSLSLTNIMHDTNEL